MRSCGNIIHTSVSAMARRLTAASVIDYFEGNGSAIAEYIADGSDDDLEMGNSGDELEDFSPSSSEDEEMDVCEDMGMYNYYGSEMETDTVTIEDPDDPSVWQGLSHPTPQQAPLATSRQGCSLSASQPAPLATEEDLLFSTRQRAPFSPSTMQPPLQPSAPLTTEQDTSPSGSSLPTFQHDSSESPTRASGRSRTRGQKRSREEDEETEEPSTSASTGGRGGTGRGGRGRGGRGRGRRGREGRGRGGRGCDSGQTEETGTSASPGGRGGTGRGGRGRGGRGRGGGTQDSGQTEETRTSSGARGRGRGRGRRGRGRGGGGRAGSNSGQQERREETVDGIVWKRDAEPVVVEEFTGNPGPSVSLSSDPLELFSLFFDPDLIDLIVRETNHYASSVPANHRSRSRGVWSTSPDEIRAYFGFMVLMGVNRLPEIRDYWSTNPLLHYSPIADRISRDRFEEITRYLHFVDNDSLPSRGQPGFSRLQKVQPILTAMKERCLAVYKPHCEVAVDEAMIPFKGRSTMKQYQPKKPVKRGFKVWCLADSHNGYFCDFNVYVGAMGDTPEQLLGERVVLRLAESIEGVHHKLFFDNFFTSFLLLRTLLSKEIYGIGTIQTTRKGFPSSALRQRGEPKPRRGDYTFRQSGAVVVTVWQDRKPVTVASTACDPTTTSLVRRRQKDGSVEMVPCPESVVTYNQYMNGVDQGDQLRGYYRVRLKCMKNYKYIFWFLFDVAVTNAFVLTRYTVPTNISRAHDTLKSFRLRLATQLIGSYCSRRRAGRPRLQPARPQTGAPEAPQHLPEHGTSKRCVFCAKERRPTRRRETIWLCPDCEGRPSLCLTGRDDGSDCYRLWHAQRNI